MSFKRYNPQTAQWEAIAVGPRGPDGPTGPIGPIGFTGSVGSLSVTNRVEYFAGNGIQTVFTLATVPRDINNTTVNINGATQFRNSYSLSGAEITFSEAPPPNSVIEVTTQLFGPAYTPFNTRTYTGNGSQTAYTVSGGVTTDSIIVALNGIVQIPTTNYTVSGTTLTFTSAPGNGVVIVVRELPGAIQGDTGFTGSGGTGFTGSVGIGFTGSSAPGFTGSRGETGGVAYAVSNNGSDTWNVNGNTNPILTLARGYTYYFNMSAPGYPLYIKTTNTIDALNVYSTGVTNNILDVGTITFTVPLDAPGNLYYVSTVGTNMVGTIQIFDAGFGYTGSVGFVGSIGGIGFTGSSGGLTTGKSIAMAIVFGG